MSNINSKSIYNIAHTFHLAAQRCEEQRPLQNGKFEMLICPAIVNYAFACELYIKYLLQINGVEQCRKHKLTDLFGLLPETSQQEIRTKMNTANFNQELNSISNAFVDWRYIYEKNNAFLHIDFLRRFCVALKEFIEQ